MATLKILASGSAGNCYVITADSGERLIVECGVSASSLPAALDYDPTAIAGCICSHRHTDHINGKAAETLHMWGIPVYGTAESAEKYPCITALADKAVVNIGGFVVMPLAVPHGDCANFAYIIDLPSNGGRLVFATDCEAFPYNVPDVRHMLIEANYDENIVRTALLESNDIHNASETHMEIDTALDAIRRHLTPSLKQVVLIHLSSAFGDERAFVEAVAAMGIPCLAARNDMEIIL